MSCNTGVAHGSLGLNVRAFWRILKHDLTLVYYIGIMFKTISTTCVKFWFWFWFSNQQDSFKNMIADGSAWGLMCQFRLK